MAVTKLFRQLQPFQIYIILALTIAFFITELIVSHVTHALVLLMDSYHMLCNIMALAGCIITMKDGSISESQDPLKKTQSKSSSLGEELTPNPNPCVDKKDTIKRSLTQDTQLRKLKNTFGWTRVDVVSTLMCCVFLASFSFSIFVEALQTLIHIDHQDEMHHPITVFCVGTVGLLLNGLCYLVIGGYTFHQGNFLYITESGDVVLSKVVVNKSVEHGERRLSRSKYVHNTSKSQKQRQRQGLWEIIRDINGCIIVIICAILIYFTTKDTAKYIDPILSLISAAVIMLLSYPYMKESCLILLQTIPDTININALKAELLNHFPDIVNVHDFHIWQLTASKIFSTVHIIFENPKVYSKIKEDLKDFFIENGISHVTIQPEFFNKNGSMDSFLNKVLKNCLFSCQEEGCKKNHCCPEYARDEELITASKECLSRNQEIKDVKIMEAAHSMHSNKIISLTDATRNVNEEFRNQINREKNESTNTETPSEYIHTELTVNFSNENIEDKNLKKKEDNDLKKASEENAETALSEDLSVMVIKGQNTSVHLDKNAIHEHDQEEEEIIERSAKCDEENENIPKDI